MSDPIQEKQPAPAIDIEKMCLMYSWLARIEYLRIQAQGMAAENEVCRRMGYALRYRDADHMDLAREMAECSHELGKLSR